MSATISDVARRAGVGIGTVSRVLNDRPLVSQETRTRVVNAITELNYVPNSTARGLSRGRTNTIAVIIPFFTRPSMVERLRGVENTLVGTDYDLTIYNVETPERRDECMRQVPRRGRADGVLVISLPPLKSDVIRFSKADVPVIFVDVPYPSVKKFNRLTVEDVKGGEQVTEFLIELGHRRIGFIGDPQTTPFNFTSSNDRLRGYCNALERARIPFHPEYVGQGEHGRAPACELARAMLQLANPPTAIFAASDTQAMGVIESARNLGLRVPQNLSVVGYDDIEVAEYLGLTTMRQPLYESGKRGVEILLNVIEHPSSKPMCEVMPIKVISRQTTAPPRA
jgi:DNA-binding LacI/PurR family transcriptional regulator